jgi:hypothetical protein
LYLEINQEGNGGFQRSQIHRNPMEIREIFEIPWKSKIRRFPLEKM